MALKLPSALASWSPAYQTRINQAVEVADAANRKKGQDVEVATELLILRSPNGARWKITVSNTGVVGAVAL
jgi:hypothetical protein